MTIRQGEGCSLHLWPHHHCLRLNSSYQIIDDIGIAHEAQTKVLVVKHATDIRIVENLQSSVGRDIQSLGQLHDDASYFVPKQEI